MKTETISQSAYSKFIEQIESSQVQRVTIKPDCIEYILKPEFGSQRYYTDPSGQIGDLKSLLQSHNVEIISLGDNSANAAGIIGLLLSSGILVGAFAWLLKFSNAGGGIGIGMKMGKSNARVYNRGKIGTTFSDVAGADEAKQELQEVVDFLSNGEKYRKIGAKIPKGILLVGSPGTGKTLLAKALLAKPGFLF